MKLGLSMLVKTRICTTLLLLLVAGALRFYKLGDWPFAGDETATIQEEWSLFHGKAEDRASQDYRLPRIIPLSYLIHHVNDEWFGRDEWGSRVIMALLGTMIVPIIYVGLIPLRGQPTALATSLLIAFWPEHVANSQVTRFYIIAAFFAYLCVLLGAYAAKTQSWRYGVAAGLLALAAILCHTLLGALLALVPAAVFIGSSAERRLPSKGIVIPFVLAGLCALSFAGLYVWPLLANWNQVHYGPIPSLTPSWRPST